MNKIPRILDEATEEAVINALARRRRLDIEPVLDIARRVDDLRASILMIHPDLSVPAYDIAGVEWMLPDAFEAKLAEGQQLLPALQAKLNRLRTEMATALRAAMTPTERALAAKIEELEARLAKLEPTKAPALPLEVRVARGERIPTAIETMCAPGMRAARTHGAAVGRSDHGGLQVLRRG
jgi:hypothetical protein